MDEVCSEATVNEGPHLRRRLSLIKAVHPTLGFILNPAFGSLNEHFWVTNVVIGFVQFLSAVVLCSIKDVTLTSYKDIKMSLHKSNGK